jgi:uncharacterized protein YlxP (DUF503 family)
VLIAHLFITLDLPYIHSLKGRRKIVSSLKERLKKKNLSILDVSSEYVKEANLEICFLSSSKAIAHKKIIAIEEIIERYYSDIEYNITYEFI